MLTLNEVTKYVAIKRSSIEGGSLIKRICVICKKVIRYLVYDVHAQAYQVHSYNNLPRDVELKSVKKYSSVLKILQLNEYHKN